jgi:hypothetical protein
VLVGFDPRDKALPANELSATETDGRNWRTAPDTTGNRLADMGFGAVQQLRHFGKSEQVEIVQSIHKRTVAGQWGRGFNLATP